MPGAALKGMWVGHARDNSTRQPYKEEWIPSEKKGGAYWGIRSSTTTLLIRKRRDLSNDPNRRHVRGAEGKFRLRRPANLGGGCPIGLLRAFLTPASLTNGAPGFSTPLGGGKYPRVVARRVKGFPVQGKKNTSAKAHGHSGFREKAAIEREKRGNIGVPNRGGGHVGLRNPKREVDGENRGGNGLARFNEIILGGGEKDRLYCQKYYREHAIQLRGGISARNLLERL